MKELNNEEFIKILLKAHQQLIVNIEKSTKLDKKLPRNKMIASIYLEKAITQLRGDKT